MFIQVYVIFSNSTSLNDCSNSVYSFTRLDSCRYIPHFSSVQFSRQSCPTLCNPMNRSTPGLPVHHQLLELAQTHIYQVSDAIQPSHPLLSPFSSCLQSFPASGSFSVSQFFASGGQSIEVSASTSVLPKIRTDLL